MNAVAAKTVDPKNQIWFSKDGERTNVGFTTSFLEVVRECWHVLPTSTGSVIKEKSPLFAVETNEALFSIAAPITGSIISFSDKAQNFPDKLTEDDVICVLGERPKKTAVDEMTTTELVAQLRRAQEDSRRIRQGRPTATPVPPTVWEDEVRVRAQIRNAPIQVANPAAATGDVATALAGGQRFFINTNGGATRFEWDEEDFAPQQQPTGQL